MVQEFRPDKKLLYNNVVMNEKHQRYIDVVSYLCRLNNKFIYHFDYLEWGDSILIMEKSGIAFIRIYWYYDNDSTCYIDMLSVNKAFRGNMIASEMISICELISSILGADRCCLWTNKDKWMHNWYQRCGYRDFEDYEGEENCVWMEKNITI